MKNFKHLSFLIFVLTCYKLNSISIILPVSANHNATSEINLLLEQPSNAFHNPSLGTNGVETSFTQLYGMDDLKLYFSHLKYPLYKGISFYIGNQYLDNPVYKEIHTSISVSYPIYESFKLGLAYRLLHTSVENYNESNISLIDFGLNYTLDNLKFGFSGRNLTGAKENNSIIPTQFIWETAYFLNSKSAIAIQTEKETNHELIFKLGSSYRILDILTILSSYQFKPARIGAGINIEYHKAIISYGVRTHRYLDLTHYISLGYAL